VLCFADQSGEPPLAVDQRQVAQVVAIMLDYVEGDLMRRPRWNVYELTDSGRLMAERLLRAGSPGAIANHPASSGFDRVGPTGAGPKRFYPMERLVALAMRANPDGDGKIFLGCRSTFFRLKI
jgi:hypothetical protein